MEQKILIIDQSHHFTEMLTTRLLNSGYDNFRTAKTGQDGMRIIQLEEPQLVVLDTRLPDMDGYHVCHNIKHQHDNTIKVLLMTGMAGRFDLDQAIKAGADEYVMKTYDCLYLMAAMQRLLSRKISQTVNQPLYHTAHH